MQCLCGSGVLDWWDVPELKISQFNFLFKRPTSTAPIALSSQQSVDGGEKTSTFLLHHCLSFLSFLECKQTSASMTSVFL